MHITLIDPYFGHSHCQWAEGFQKYSTHEVDILSLPGKFWKWRMHGGAVTLAQEFLEKNTSTDLLLATDMLDLNVFLSLTRSKSKDLPAAIYFHENQLNYPISEQDKMSDLNNHYSFINYASALAADKVFFNSDYHRKSFLEALPPFLQKFPDHRNTETVEIIAQKSEVLHLGMELSPLQMEDPPKNDKKERAVILWNHRWEYDKNPKAFFEALYTLKERGIEFQLIVLGEPRKAQAEIFEKAQKRLEKFILHWGYVKDFETYKKLLWKADILPVTSHQDFFGGSVVEASYCNCIPLLPKRLAYPEHFPSFMHPSLFYEENDFVNKLQRLILDVNVIRNQNTQKFVSHYDWNKMISIYDKKLEDIIE